MTERLSLESSEVLPSPNELQDVWGLVDESVVREFHIEQSPGSETYFMPTWDGRRIAAEVSGPMDGRPMLFFHGTPGCRLGPKPDAAWLAGKGVHLYCYDRPGFGFSSPRPGHKVVDAAEDFIALIDAFGLDDGVSIVARSGGVGHALACAERWPQYVLSLALLVPPAPRRLMGLDWYDGMMEDNVNIFTAAFEQGDREAVRARLEAHTRQIQQNSLSLLNSFGEHGPRGRDADQKLAMAATHAAALRQGCQAWVDEVFGLELWNFPLEQVGKRWSWKNRVETFVWTGTNDVFAPSQQAEALATTIGADVVMRVRGATHFGAIEAMKQGIEWCLENDYYGIGKKYFHDSV